MHELSLCQNIVALIEEQAQQQSFQRVKSVHLGVGDLSCVEKNALLFSFDVVTKNTLATGAKLNIESISGKAYCQQCQKIVIIKRLIDPCVECQNFLTDIRQGQEIIFKAMEVE